MIPKLQTSKDVKEEEGCSENAPLLQQLCVALQQLKTNSSKCFPTSLTSVAKYDLDVLGSFKIANMALLCQTCYITSSF